jgi:dephospho-CoA kinase
MSRILITGMSGVGKSSVVNELRARGHRVVDTDYDGWTRTDGTWDEPRMDDLLDGHLDLVVAGTVENQGRYYPRFDQVVLLSAPLETILDRVQSRTNNPYGATETQQAEIANYVKSVEPLLRRGATIEIDAQRPLVEIADLVETLLRPTH